MTTILFDLDGTLVDTGPDLLAATNAVIEGDSLEPIAITDLGHLVGQGGRAMLERAYRLRGQEITDERLDAKNADFMRIYGDGIPGASRPFDGLVNCLDRLDVAGHAFAVCTNKPEGFSRKLLEALGLAPRFKAICGPDTFGVRKPDPEHVFRTLDAAGGARNDAIMVGDSVNDIEAARRADVPSIGVPFGYTDVPIRDLNPTVTIEHFDELDEALIQRLVRKA